MDHTPQSTEPTPPELNLPVEEAEPTPLGFKIFVGFGIAYLGLRAFQMVEWGIDWLRGVG